MTIHLNGSQPGKNTIRMVDVGKKPMSRRTAMAVGRIAMKRKTLEQIREGRMKKGNVIEAARLAAVMGAKRTADFVPLCHPLPLTAIDVCIEEETLPRSTLKRSRQGRSMLRVTVQVRTIAQTGVEMEALTGVSAALLTIYDMSKSVDQAMTMGGIGLVQKRGGRSGDVQRSPSEIFRGFPPSARPGGQLW